MIVLKACPACEVPDYISKEHLWLNNGDIVQAREPWHRLLFFESESLQPFFHDIEKIFGVSVDGMVITAMREAISQYLRLLIPHEIQELIQEKRIDPRPLGTVTADIAKLAGFGNYEVVGARYEQDENDFVTMRITNPAFLNMAIASLAASAEVLHGVSQEITCKEVAPGSFEITVFPSPQPREAGEVISLRPYHHLDGGLEMERCAICGAPEALMEYRWNLEGGIILHRNSGRRMCFISPQILEPIFERLMEEFGESVTKAVVETQRRLTKSGFYFMPHPADSEDLRRLLALRGLGNLKEMELTGEGMRLRVDNAALPIIIVGLFQGFFEMANNVESRVDWELSPDGALEVEVTLKP